jgi:hypothetical protein
MVLPQVDVSEAGRRRSLWAIPARNRSTLGFNGEQKPGRFVAGRLLSVDDRAHAFNGEQKPNSFGVRLLPSVGNRAHAFQREASLGSRIARAPEETVGRRARSAFA